MKKRLLKFALPMVLGIALMGITLFGLVGCEPIDGGSTGGGSTGCQPKTGCPLSSPWLGAGRCYATSAACIAGQGGSGVCRKCN